MKFEPIVRISKVSCGRKITNLAKVYEMTGQGCFSVQAAMEGNEDTHMAAIMRVYSLLVRVRANPNPR